MVEVIVVPLSFSIYVHVTDLYINVDPSLFIVYIYIPIDLTVQWGCLLLLCAWWVDSNQIISAPVLGKDHSWCIIDIIIILLVSLCDMFISKINPL